MKKLGWLFLSLISFVLCVIIYVESNTDKLYSLQADYYFKKNDIKNAVKLYEQAFDSGCKDSKARDSYVNIMINSPLNAEAQEKLVKFIKYPIDDNAKYKAESFLSDLRTEINNKYHDNYISQAVFNQKTLRWSTMPITYSYINVKAVPGYYIDEFDYAFKDWETLTDGKVKFEKREKGTDIVIRFNEAETSLIEADDRYVAAYTKPIITNNFLKKMLTDVYITTPNGEYLSKNQVFNTAIHEIGHALGIMGHSNYRKSVMNMGTDNMIVSNDLRKSLLRSDINTLKLLYDIKPDITNIKNPKGEYTQYLVMGNEEEVANAKFKEARNYIQKAPNLPSGYIDLAEAAMALQDYGNATRFLKKALSLSDTDELKGMIYYNLAVTSYYNENYKEAKYYLNKSLEIKNSETNEALMARICASDNEIPEAVNIYETLINKNPENIEYVIELTNIYVKNKNYIKARNVLKEFVKKNPSERSNPRLAPYGIIKAFL